jgi:mycothiol synthase
MVRPPAPAPDMPPLPEGCRMTTYSDEFARDWAKIINRSIEWGWNTWFFERKILRATWFTRDGLFFVVRNGRAVGTACASAKTIDGIPYGLVHMVGVLPGQRGHGFGRALTIAVMRHLLVRENRPIGLFTKPRFAAAIGMYASLGFRPHVLDPSHIPVWQRLRQSLDIPFHLNEAGISTETPFPGSPGPV